MKMYKRHVVYFTPNSSYELETDIFDKVVEVRSIFCGDYGHWGYPYYYTRYGKKVYLAGMSYSYVAKVARDGRLLVE